MTSIVGSLYEYVVAPLLRIMFQILALAHPKIRTGVEMRRIKDGRPPWLTGEPGTQPIWIHCASGEFEYAKPVIRELKRLRGEQKILVTYFSPTIASAVAKFPGVDLYAPSPWENAGDVRELLNYHKPRALLIARTDTWPIMLREAHASGIPILLFSATLTSQAGRLRPLMRQFSNWVFSFLTEIFAVTEDDRRNFTELNISAPVVVAGDTRFDQVIARLSEPKPIKEIFSKQPLLVAGSTWDEDEAQLVPVIHALKDKLVFAIAPHEPTAAHIQALQERLRNHGLKSTLYSAANDWPSDVPVLIVDQVGILAEVYTKAQFAFVGGSFKKTVHSVMEPLAAGCITFVGPLHHNNREALEFKALPLPDQPGFQCVNEVRDSGEWQDKLASLLMSRVVSASFIREEIKKRSGRSRQVAEWVLDRI